MIRYFVLAISLLIATTAGAATYGQVFQSLLTQQRATGAVLSGGKVYFYTPGTETLATVWTTRTKSTPAANPGTLSSDGTLAVYGDGQYDVKITTAAGVQKYYWYGVSLVDSSSIDTNNAAFRAYTSIDRLKSSDGRIASIYDVANYSSMPAAITAIGATNATLRYGANISLIDNLTVPANVVLQPYNGAVITIASAKVLTITGGQFPVPRVTAFAGDGTVAGLKEVFPEWWGITGTADQTAINKAIVAVKPILTSQIGDLTNPLTHGKVLLDPYKEYLLTAPIELYSSVKLLGGGSGTIIKEDSGFTGDMLVKLKYQNLTPKMFQFGEIAGITFEASTADMAAIMPDQDVPLGTVEHMILNSHFHDLFFDIPRGLIFTAFDGTYGQHVYCQEVRIDNLYAYGPVEEILVFSGNLNYINGIQDESYPATTTAEPFIHQTTYNSPLWDNPPSTPSPARGGNDNIYSRLFLEPDGNATKTQLRIYKGTRTEINHFYSEAGDVEYPIELEECLATRFKGSVRINDDSQINLIKSKDTHFDEFRVLAGTTDWWGTHFNVDAFSDVHIGHLNALGMQLNAFPILPRLQVDSFYNGAVADSINSGSADFTGVVPHQMMAVYGRNKLLTNGNFNTAITDIPVVLGDTWYVSGTPTDTYTATGIGNGRQLKLEWAAPSAAEYLTQFFNIPAPLVGKKIKLSIPVKVVGVGVVYAEMDSIGMGTLAGTTSRAYNTPAPIYEDWQLLRYDFVPQSANASASIQIWFSGFAAATDVYLDEVILSVED